MQQKLLKKQMVDMSENYPNLMIIKELKIKLMDLCELHFSYLVTKLNYDSNRKQLFRK